MNQPFDLMDVDTIVVVVHTGVGTRANPAVYFVPTDKIDVRNRDLISNIPEGRHIDVSNEDADHLLHVLTAKALNGSDEADVQEDLRIATEAWFNPKDESMIVDSGIANGVALHALLSVVKTEAVWSYCTDAVWDPRTYDRIATLKGGGPFPVVAVLDAPDFPLIDTEALAPWTNGSCFTYQDRENNFQRVFIVDPIPHLQFNRGVVPLMVSRFTSETPDEESVNQTPEMFNAIVKGFVK